MLRVGWRRKAMLAGLLAMAGCTNAPSVGGVLAGAASGVVTLGQATVSAVATVGGLAASGAMAGGSAALGVASGGAGAVAGVAGAVAGGASGGGAAGSAAQAGAGGTATTLAGGGSASGAAPLAFGSAGAAAGQAALEAITEPPPTDPALIEATARPAIDAAARDAAQEAGEMLQTRRTALDACALRVFRAMVGQAGTAVGGRWVMVVAEHAEAGPDSGAFAGIIALANRLTASLREAAAELRQSVEGLLEITEEVPLRDAFGMISDLRAQCPATAIARLTGMVMAEEERRG
jgi:hypothetical protein